MALDRADRGQPGRLQAADVRGAGAGRQEDDVGAEAAAIGERDGRAGRTGKEGDGRPGHELHAGGPAGGDEGRQEGTVVHVVVAGNLDPPAQHRGERRHQRPALRGRAPGGGAAQRVLVGQEVVEGGAIGRIEGDRQRAGLVVADVVARRLLQRGGELLPASGPLEEQLRQGRLTELDLGDGGQHPGGHPRGAVAPGRGGHQGHLVARPGQSPGAREADDPAPDHEHPLRHAPSLLSPFDRPSWKRIVEEDRVICKFAPGPAPSRSTFCSLYFRKDDDGHRPLRRLVRARRLRRGHGGRPPRPGRVTTSSTRGSPFSSGWRTAGRRGPRSRRGTAPGS